MTTHPDLTAHDLTIADLPDSEGSALFTSATTGAGKTSGKAMVAEQLFRLASGDQAKTEARARDRFVARHLLAAGGRELAESVFGWPLMAAVAVLVGAHFGWRAGALLYGALVVVTAVSIPAVGWWRWRRVRLAGLDARRLEERVLHIVWRARPLPRVTAPAPAVTWFDETEPWWTPAAAVTPAEPTRLNRRR